MAITISSVDKKLQGSQQFQGIFKEMWAVTATVSFAAAAAAGEDTGAITVPGVAVGDMVVALGFNADPEENIFFYQAMVSAANTVSLSFTNASGSSDTPGPTQIKILIGRPSW